MGFLIKDTTATTTSSSAASTTGTRAELPGESTEMINQTMKRKRSGYTNNSYIEKGVEEDPQAYTKTLLGG